MAFRKIKINLRSQKLAFDFALERLKIIKEVHRIKIQLMNSGCEAKNSETSCLSAMGGLLPAKKAVIDLPWLVTLKSYFFPMKFDPMCARVAPDVK